MTRFRKHCIQLAFLLVSLALSSPPSKDFARFIGKNIDKWTKVIKFAGIKPQ